MSVLDDPGLFHDNGRRDSRRHHDRIREEIADQLKKTIGDQDLITAGPDRKIRVPIKGTKRWRFVFGDDKEGVGQGRGDVGDSWPIDGDGLGGDAGTEPGEELYEVWLDQAELEQHLFEQLGLPRLRPTQSPEMEVDSIVYDSRAKKGPLLDKRATVIENLRRNTQERGEAILADVSPDDLRYRTYRELPKPKTQAAIILAMDVSGSMGEFHKRVARLFFWWACRFLRSRHERTEIVFVAHHVEANEVTEDQFFNRQAGGGTMASSAYTKALEIAQDRFPVSDWNLYVLHASDGDNLMTDNPRVKDLLGEILAIANLVGYIQIDSNGGRLPFGISQQSRKTLIDTVREVEDVIACRVKDDSEIWAALKRVFHLDDDQPGGLVDGTGVLRA